MDIKEINRWLRALEIAKALFEDQGYHSLYLTQIQEFIGRKLMYSPKIDEDLIPKLYRLALIRNLPMTKLVNRILASYLAQADVDKEQAGVRTILRKVNQ
jgi:hypothetical protein